MKPFNELCNSLTLALAGSFKVTGGSFDCFNWERQRNCLTGRVQLRARLHHYDKIASSHLFIRVCCLPSNRDKMQEVPCSGSWLAQNMLLQTNKQAMLSAKPIIWQWNVTNKNTSHFWPSHTTLTYLLTGTFYFLMNLYNCRNICYFTETNIKIYEFKFIKNVDLATFNQLKEGTFWNVQINCKILISGLSKGTLHNI